MNTPTLGVVIFITTLLFSIVLYAPLYEWLLHKYFMHKRPGIGKWKFTYAFNAHAVIHHHVFKADSTYHVQDKKDKHLIPMAWWNGPILIALGMIPFIALCHYTGHSIAIISGAMLGCSLYYGAYEYFHWCMHDELERQRLVERFWFFRRLNGHHILHHRYMGNNYNVVLPVYDFLFGTLITRSKIAFPQVRGKSVPDVQPLNK